MTGIVCVENRRITFLYLVLDAATMYRYIYDIIWHNRVGRLVSDDKVILTLFFSRNEFIMEKKKG